MSDHTHLMHIYRKVCDKLNDRSFSIDSLVVPFPNGYADYSSMSPSWSKEWIDFHGTRALIDIDDQGIGRSKIEYLLDASRDDRLMHALEVSSALRKRLGLIRRMDLITTDRGSVKPIRYTTPVYHFVSSDLNRARVRVIGHDNSFRGFLFQMRPDPRCFQDDSPIAFLERVSRSSMNLSNLADRIESYHEARPIVKRWL